MRYSFGYAEVSASQKASSLRSDVRHPPPAAVPLTPTLYEVLRVQLIFTVSPRSFPRSFATPRPRGQAVKTSPFHGGNTGSNPVGVIKVPVHWTGFFLNRRNPPPSVVPLPLRTLSSVG